MKKNETLTKFFLNKYLIIIELKYVDRNNDLSVFEKKKTLNHEEFILVSEDDNITLSDKEREIFLFVFLNML